MSAATLAAAAVALVCAGGLVAFALAALAAATRPRVLCLMYHRVASRESWEALRGGERLFTLPDDAFDAQLGWLRERGYRLVGAGDVARFARGEGRLEDRSVLLTIDDGCVSAHTRMLPILRRHGAQVILFVTTDAASAVFRDAGAGERRLTDAEIRELAAAGVEIGSHAVSHRPLSAMHEEEIRRELVDSKRELERVTGAPVRYFAVPANWFDARVLRIARETGYEAVFCSRPGTVRHGGGAFGIARVNVEGGLDLEGFARALSPAGIAQRRLVMALRGLPKRLVGPRVWTALRESALGRAGGHWLSPSRMAAAAAIAVGAGLLATLGWLLARS